jgi:hypothetical protein
MYKPSFLTHKLCCILLMDYKLILPKYNINSIIFRIWNLCRGKGFMSSAWHSIFFFSSLSTGIYAHKMVMISKVIVLVQFILRKNWENNRCFWRWLSSGCLALMMEAARTSETLVHFYQTTWCYNPEDSHLCTHCHENLRSYLTGAWRCFMLWNSFTEALELNGIIQSAKDLLKCIKIIRHNLSTAIFFFPTKSF